MAKESQFNCTHHDMMFPCAYWVEGDDGYQGNLTPHHSTDDGIGILQTQGGDDNDNDDLKDVKRESLY
eukprot:3372674-Ditylum_brightwellii.AAC.1